VIERAQIDTLALAKGGDASIFFIGLVYGDEEQN
jgi:hypothetical protein